MSDTPIRTHDGVQKVYPTQQPWGFNTAFTGAGDDGGFAAGPKLLFSLAAQDSEKSVEISFDDEVYIKDGWVIPVNAPFGAGVDIAVLDEPNGNPVFWYCKNVPLLGDCPVVLHTEDCHYFPAGTILRFTAKNAAGTGGEDPPGAFKAAVYLKLYRQNTVY